MTPTSKHAGAPSTALKLSFHEQPQGLLGTKEDSEGLLAVRGSFPGPRHTHHCFSRPAQRSMKGTEGRSEQQSLVSQNFSKLTELYSKRELLLGRAQRAHLIQPIHFQRQTETQRSLSTAQGHTVSDTRIQELGAAICAKPLTQPTRQAGESWQQEGLHPPFPAS